VTPTCYVAIRDDAVRALITESLSELGWNVIARPTGFHLVEQLADVILAPSGRRGIDLVVVEERSPGCRGSSIARGLRDLGIDVPVALIAELAPKIASEDRVYVIEPEWAAIAIPAIARSLHAPSAQPAVAA
jgi:hypothetical protein